MITSKAGIDLIAHYEGCKLKAYKPVKSEKYYTIGYGHYGADVSKDMTITKQQAIDMLAADLKKFERIVERNCKHLNLNVNEFSALVSFTYNCGEGNLQRLIRGRSKAVIAQKILLYNKAGGKQLAGLVKRRKSEQMLYLTGEWK